MNEEEVSAYCYDLQCPFKGCCQQSIHTKQLKYINFKNMTERMYLEVSLLSEADGVLCLILVTFEKIRRVDLAVRTIIHIFH